MGDVKTTPKQVINDHKTYTKSDLEWSDDRHPVAHIQMTKTLTPAEQLTQWYQTTTHNDVVDKFYNYWFNRLSTNGWNGHFDLNNLIQKYCK